MPTVPENARDARELWQAARVTAAAAQREFDKTAVPFYGMGYRNFMFEYNRIIKAALRLLDPESAPLLRPYDLSRVPCPREIDESSWRIHLLHVTNALRHLATYLKRKAEAASADNPTVVLTNQPMA